LRTGKAAPETTCQGGEEKQGEGSNDQEEGQVNKVLRPEDKVENVEFAGGEVKEDRLSVIPL
jgi:hypothetical protein